MAMRMFKQRRSQAVFFGLMVSIFVFIVLVSMIPTMKSFVNTARDTSHLNCTSPALSAGDSVSCIVTDWYMFYFISAVIAVSVGFVSGRQAVNIIQ
jgi:glycerol uptake facilitator-like aquaporin